ASNKRISLGRRSPAEVKTVATTSAESLGQPGFAWFRGARAQKGFSGNSRFHRSDLRNHQLNYPKGKRVHDAGYHEEWNVSVKDLEYLAGNEGNNHPTEGPRGAAQSHHGSHVFLGKHIRRQGKQIR